MFTKLLLLLFAIVVPCTAVVPFPWWDGIHRHQKQKTVEACCPTEDDGTKPLFCCAYDLFEKEPTFPLKSCLEADENVQMATIFRTVRCAQRHFNRLISHRIGSAPTDICGFFCCDLLKNVQGESKETDCSRNCTRAAFTVGMTKKKQLRRLRKLGCEAEAPIQFKALEECLEKPGQILDINGKEDDQTKLLQEVCNRENGE